MSKTYSVTIHSEAQERQKAFQETDEFKKKYRERYKIEAKNSFMARDFNMIWRIHCYMIKNRYICKYV